MVFAGRFRYDAGLPRLGRTMLPGDVAVVGEKAPLWPTFAYACADFYVSSITPSATGGQPAVVYYMRKDGVSVAKEIELKDKFENMGACMVREVASKTSDNAGDGTTTATVLAQAIVDEGMKFVAAGMNPMDLKRGIDKAVAAAIEELRKISKPTTTNKEIAQVGAISANSDAEVISTL